MADESQPSREDLDALPDLDVPTFNPVQFNIFANSNEVTIVGAESKSLLQNYSLAATLRLKFNFALKLSPQPAKDLLVNLGNMIERYENIYGKIATDMTRSLAGKNEQS